jgi:hypothetical protein
VVQKNQKPSGVSYAELNTWATQWIGARYVVTCKELESACDKEFQAQWTGYDLSPMGSAQGRPKKRTHWENGVDWVKAHWTKHHKTVSKAIGEEKKKYLYWAPTPELQAAVKNVDSPDCHRHWRRSRRRSVLFHGVPPTRSRRRLIPGGFQSSGRSSIRQSRVAPAGCRAVHPRPPLDARRGK